MHRRKVGRLWARFMSLETWGYFVGTIPHYIDRKYILKRVDAKALDYMSTSLKRYMKRQGYKVGISAWHFSGDKQKGLNYNPHINVVIEEGFLPEHQLEKLKNAWSKIVCKVLKMPKIQVVSYYEYTQDRNKAVHLIKYITRATYFGSDRNIRKIITGFRNIRTWGTFPKPTQKSENLALQELKGLDVYRAGVKALEVVHINEFSAYHKADRLEYIGLGLWLQKFLKDKVTNCHRVRQKNGILPQKSTLIFYNLEVLQDNCVHTFAKKDKKPLFFRKSLADLASPYGNAWTKLKTLPYLEPETILLAYDNEKNLTSMAGSWGSRCLFSVCPIYRFGQFNGKVQKTRIRRH
jgi:hypothetical protein